MDTICEPNIMILAQDILLTRFHRLIMAKSKKRWKRGITLQQKVWRKRKKYRSSYFSYLFLISNFKILSLTVLDHMQSVTMQGCTHRQAKTNMLPQLLESWGHKNYQEPTTTGLQVNGHLSIENTFTKPFATKTRNTIKMLEQCSRLPYYSVWNILDMCSQIVLCKHMSVSDWLGHNEVGISW